jgi:hypothetical protein
LQDSLALIGGDRASSDALGGEVMDLSLEHLHLRLTEHAALRVVEWLQRSFLLLFLFKNLDGDFDVRVLNSYLYFVVGMNILKNWLRVKAI